jgi:riboflavin synthase
MFTGIIQNTAKVIRRRKADGQIHFVFKLRHPEKRPLERGESIAVNGVCLTAARCGKDFFEADVVRETLQATTLGLLEAGSEVNLERSLRWGDSLSGHFVTGHVDAKARILKIEKEKKNRTFSIESPKSLLPFFALKGSVALDGISLTIQGLSATSLRIAIVPHTLRNTTLSQKKPGDLVNLEVDLISRYLRRLDGIVGPRKTGRQRRLTAALLKKHGF